MKIVLFILFFVKSLYAGPFESLEDKKSNPKHGWISADNPGIILGKFDPSYTNFPRVGKLDKSKIDVWSDSYWPKYRGGIAFRWKKNERPRRTKLYSLRKLRKMTQEQISQLSPAEKYDIARGDYEYSFTRRILASNPSSSPEWRGICHGWAEASITHRAPKPKVFINRDKIRVKFGYSDLASFLSYMHAKRRGGVRFLGKRCNQNGSDSVACSGINPGALHILLTNSMAKQRSFLLDVSRGLEVWNHPIVGYYFREVGERSPSLGSAKDTVKEVKIKIEMNYIIENIESDTRLPSQVLSKNYTYWLELDKDNKIIGGSWVSYDRPDFAWYRNSPRISTKYRFLFQ